MASAVLFRLIGVDHRITDAIERAFEQDVRHRKSLFAGAGQEIRHVSIEPGVVTAGRPQAERTVRALPRQEPVDRVLDALIDIGVHGKMRAGREFVDIEQRHRAAGDLLRTSVRIAVERFQDGRGIERRGKACRQRNAAGARHEIGEHVRGQRQALALGQGPDRTARQDLRGGLDVERVVPRQRQAFRSPDVDIELRGAGAVGIERQRHRAALLCGELYGGRWIAQNRYRP